MKTGIYVNHKTREMFVHQSRRTQSTGIVDFQHQVKKMVEHGFEYLCYTVGIASLQENETGYKFVTHVSYTKPGNIKDDALKHAEAIVAILKKEDLN